MRTDYYGEHFDSKDGEGSERRWRGKMGRFIIYTPHQM
jgi:hypothetical protein